MGKCIKVLQQNAAHQTGGISTVQSQTTDCYLINLINTTIEPGQDE